MTDTLTQARLIGVVRDHFGRNSYPGSAGETVEAVLSLDTRLDADLVTDFRLDSLDLVEFTMAVEDEFSVEVTDDEAAGFVNSTLRSVAALIDGKLAAKAVAA